MHPILIVVLVINAFVIITLGGIVGLLFTGAVVAILYNLIGRDGRPASQYRATLAAIGSVYLIAGYLIVRAPWSVPEMDVAAVILELFIFAIFSALGKR